MPIYDPDLMAFKFDFRNFTPSGSLWNIFWKNIPMYFMFSTRVDPVTKQMYPKSVEIDKSRRTDYRCSDQVG